MNLFFIGGGNSTHIIIEELKNSINKAYIFDTNPESYKDLLLNYSFTESVSLDEIKNGKIKNIKIDFAIECASIDAVIKYSETILKNDLNFIILSTGAFANKNFYDKFFKLLNHSKSNVYIPSGAIGGLDIIYSIKDRITSVTLTTKKPPYNLGITENLNKPKIIFEGDVYKAIQKFPKNINVAVTIAVTIRDFTKVNVKIVADPEVKRNIHSIRVKSDAGFYTFEIENLPSKNGRTSLLAPLSIVSLLKKLNSNFRIN